MQTVVESEKAAQHSKITFQSKPRQLLIKTNTFITTPRPKTCFNRIILYNKLSWTLKEVLSGGFDIFPIKAPVGGCWYTINPLPKKETRYDIHVPSKPSSELHFTQVAFSAGPQPSSHSSQPPCSRHLAAV